MAFQAVVNAKGAHRVGFARSIRRAGPGRRPHTLLPARAASLAVPSSSEWSSWERFVEQQWEKAGQAGEFLRGTAEKVASAAHNGAEQVATRYESSVRLAPPQVAAPTAPPQAVAAPPTMTASRARTQAPVTVLASSAESNFKKAGRDLEGAVDDTIDSVKGAGKDARRSGERATDKAEGGFGDLVDSVKGSANKAYNKLKGGADDAIHSVNKAGGNLGTDLEAGFKRATGKADDEPEWLKDYKNVAVLHGSIRLLLGALALAQALALSNGFSALVQSVEKLFGGAPAFAATTVGRNTLLALAAAWLALAATDYNAATGENERFSRIKTKVELETAFCGAVTLASLVAVKSGSTHALLGLAVVSGVFGLWNYYVLRQNTLDA